MATNAMMSTAIGTILFPYLDQTAKLPDGRDSGKHEVTLVVGPQGAKSAEHARLTAEVERLRAEAAKEWKVPVSQVRSPLRANEERAEKYPETYAPGGFFFSAKTKFRPTVVDAQKRPITDLSNVYAGQEGRLVVSCFKYNTSGNRGVGLSLDVVQITNADRPRIGGGGSALDALSDLPAADPFAA